MDLIGTLDVEEKARAKDTRARGIEGGSSANLVQKKNFQPHKFKNKGKFDGKIVRLKNVHYVPSVNKNLVSGSLLCRDGYKLVFESNKFVISKYGTFVGKGYESGGLFRLSLSDVCNKVVNHICNNSESSVWHSRLCHVNFGCMSRLAKLNLIPSFTTVKGSKCQVCVQAKQPRKSHMTAETRNLAPLELIHSDLCEMNGVLTKGGKKYFMTLIDDSTRYCHVYLLKSKDEALNFFKIYKAEVEN